MSELDLEMTPALKQMMSGFYAIDLKSSFKWVPQMFRLQKKLDTDLESGPFTGGYLFDKRLWPVFEITMQSGMEAAEYEDTIVKSVVQNIETKEQRSTLAPGTQRVNLLKKHIKGWSNFRDHQGALIEFDPKIHLDKSGQLSDAAISLMGFDLQEDLKRAIQNHMSLTDEEMLGLE